MEEPNQERRLLLAVALSLLVLTAYQFLFPAAPSTAGRPGSSPRPGAPLAPPSPVAVVGASPAASPPPRPGTSPAATLAPAADERQRRAEGPGGRGGAALPH